VSYKNCPFNRERKPMKKFVIAALVVAFATPALAMDYYVALRLGGGGGCVIMTHAPNAKKYKMMGMYPTKVQARRAMTGMAKCQ
jgi:hypothetical protein